jgi:cell division protein FtsN
MEAISQRRSKLPETEHNSSRPNRRCGAAAETPNYNPKVEGNVQIPRFNEALGRELGWCLGVGAYGARGTASSRRIDLAAMRGAKHASIPGPSV